MFEGTITDILNRLLGSYVTASSFHSDRVSASVYQGHVSLSKLELRSDALDRLLLPVTLHHGSISSVEILIPWTALGSKSLEITLDGVHLVINPKTDWSDEELERRELASKMAKLLQAEVIRGMVQQQQQQQHANSTFTSRIMDRMISNVVVRLRNVQVKFESLRYSFSLNIGRFDMYNTDANWSPFYSQDPQSQFKLTRLENVSLYDEDKSSHVLHPFHLTIKHQLFPRDNSSKVDIQVQDLLEVVVVHSQLENLVEILKLRAVSKLRPTQPPIVAPRQWWQYACQILLKRIKDKRYRRTKEYFTKRRRDRLEYTYLWKLFLSSENGNNNSSATTTTTTTIASSNNGQVVISPSSFANTHNKLSANNKAKLEFLESYLDLADILLFRAYAENELRLEKAHQELWAMSTAAAAAQKQAQPTSESGWISWARGMRTFPAGSSNNSSQKESLSQQDVERFL
ncbi:hypothetical protein BASA82_000056, partial [Batrachochytrium salamandrivorans]